MLRRLLFALLVLPAFPAWSATIALYEAGTAGAPPDPSSVAGGSWTLSSSGSGHSSGPVIDDLGSGLDAWNVTDGSTGAGGIAYTRSIAPADIAQGTANGWLLQGTVRVTSGVGPDPAQFLLFDDGSLRWSMLFDLDASGDLFIEVQADAGNQIFTLTTGGTGSAAYHDYEIEFDPVSGLAAIRFDGSTLTSSYAGLSSIFIFESVLFGSGSSFGQGSTNYHRVAFSIVPEPAALALAGLVLLAALGRRRQRRPLAG